MPHFLAICLPPPRKHRSTCRHQGDVVPKFRVGVGELSGVWGVWGVPQSLAVDRVQLANPSQPRKRPSLEFGVAFADAHEVAIGVKVFRLPAPGDDLFIQRRQQRLDSLESGGDRARRQAQAQQSQLRVIASLRRRLVGLLAAFPLWFVLLRIFQMVAAIRGRLFFRLLAEALIAPN
jgi:hypothetical protein